jgi:hypothetical protein
MVQNVMPGHTQVFNRALMKEIIGRFDPNIHVVDWWIYLIASALGQIAFDETVTVLHRQHHRNAVGYELNWLKKALHRLKTVHGDKANAISRQLNAFFVKYCNELTDEHRREVQRYFHHQKDILSRLKFAFTSRVYRQTGFETLLFKILYVVGKYKL